MDRGDLVQLVSTSVQEEMVREARALVDASLKQAATETGETWVLTKDESEAIDLGIYAGMTGAVKTLVKYKIIPGASDGDR